MSKTSKKTKPVNRTRAVRLTLKHEFNQQERNDRAEELARVTREIAEVSEEAKQIATNYKGKVSEKKARQTVLANELGTGFTHRETECTVTYHDPKTGKKTTRRNDTKAVHTVEDMTSYECQEELDLKEAEKKKAEKTPNPVLSEEDAKKLAVKEVLAGEETAEGDEK